VNRSRVLVAVVCLLAAVTVIQAALFSCPKCGYEQPEGATKCSHCGAALTPPVAATNQPVVTPPAVRTAWANAAEAEFNKAKAAGLQGKSWLAWFYTRNALALNTLSGETKAVREADLVKAQKQVERTLCSTEVKCPVCDGSGRRAVKVRMSDGRMQAMSSDSLLCLRCGGSGRLPAVRMSDALNHERAQAARDYTALQQDRNWVGLSGVWLPPDLASGLTLSNRVAIIQALGSPCLNCAGMGVLACTRCEGTGYLKCSNGDCVMGTVTCPDCGGSGTPKKTDRFNRGTLVTSFCNTCQGTGRITCKTCRGKAFLPCPVCQGKTALVCKVCNGSGQNPECTKCHGGGLIACTHCKGTGKYRGETCPECQGQGEILCSTCQGVGRVSRR